MLFSIAKPFMDLRLGAKVQSIDPDTPSVTLVSGETIFADLIIGADGIHSVVRRSIIGESKIPLSTPLGDMAFRALIPASTMMDDPELRDLIENPRLTCWMGPNRHVMGYRVVRLGTSDLHLF
jgi:salicylate hydroxylase